jgi:hypothetical protein
MIVVQYRGRGRRAVIVGNRPSSLIYRWIIGVLAGRR